MTASLYSEQVLIALGLYKTTVHSSNSVLAKLPKRGLSVAFSSR